MPYKDPEKAREFWRQRDARRRADNPNECRARVKRSRLKHMDRFLSTVKAYRETHPEKAKEWQDRNYAKRRVREDVKRQRHEEYLRMKTDPRLKQWRRTGRINRALRKGKNGGHCSPEQWFSRCEYYGFKCAYCERPLGQQEIEIEHIIPIAKGGTGWASNLAPACRSCNNTKKANIWWPARLVRFGAPIGRWQVLPPIVKES